MLFSVEKINSVATGPEDTLYILGSKNYEAVVLVAKKEQIVHQFIPSEGCRICGITSLLGQPPMITLLQQHFYFRDDVKESTVQEFRELCKKLPTLDCSAEDGEPFYNFFAPIQANAQAQKKWNVLSILEVLYQNMSKSLISAFIHMCPAPV